jgi:regulator of sigma E protease
VIFLVVLALLVLVHEFGHFVTARKAGMRVEEFGFGFPPKIWCKKIKDTVYSINWLPLGGFVKIKGEDGDAANEPDSFGFQKAWKRVIVLVAGVVMNFLLACVLLSIGFMIGLPADFSTGTDSKAIVVSPPAVMVQYVEKGSPAEKIGIKFGDEIILINNEAMKSSQQMVGFVQTHGEEELTITVKRKDGEQTLKATPQVLKVGDTTPRLGVMLADAGIIRYPWYISLYKGFIAAGIGLINIFIAFYILLKNLIIGKGLAFDVSGPVGIAVMVGQSARMGISYLINVTAMISLSLTAINILPIPALDGGRILFILIEKIIRRPVNRKYEQYAHMVGFALLMLLILVVTGRDILGLIK